MKTVGLISLGCAKNRVDAEHLLGGLAAHGFEIVEDLAAAEVVIVNTCGFIRDAVEESIQEILEAARLKEEGACETLVVAGCLAKRYSDLAAELPEVDHFFTPEDVPMIPALLGGGCGVAYDPAARVLTQPPHSAYLKIAEGCSNRCTYCTIPSIRGPFRSASEEEVLAEARCLAEAGAVELNVIAQDVTSYGRDRGEPAALVPLLEKLQDIQGIAWLRLLYAYPGRFPDGLAELLAGGGKVVPYVDAPIQHVHPRILKAMGRRTTAAEVEEGFLALREKVPGLVLRTTAIVGFPGETDEEFAALAEFVERMRFHHLGAFLYSPEEGTPAARLKPSVPRKVAKARLDHLLQLQAEVSAGRNREFVGKILDVLTEGVDESGQPVGRTYGQAPEVDGLTLLRGLEGPVQPGKFLKARITEAFEYDLVGVIEPSRAGSAAGSLQPPATGGKTLRRSPSRSS
ncbi:MAG: 30S ribosomal protein S12 methylthiotransferase RimO [Deltaproteobacteria bacterium]|nr:30S ribosomal protein S12 methylthiotransferase RimO [Deltaproteobacteria bacterium]